MDDNGESWFILKAESCSSSDPYAAKGWLLTARSLYPLSFSIQFEDYALEKKLGNTKDAAHCLYEMFTNFPSEKKLLLEVQHIVDSLQSDCLDNESLLYRELFGSLPTDIQCQLLLNVSNQTRDTLEQCRTMLLILKRFPMMIPQQGIYLADSLLSAEKHSHLQTPVNSYRKYFVCDVLPLILKSEGVDINEKQVFRWLQKAIEFYTSYLTMTYTELEEHSTPAIQDLQSSKKALSYTSSSHMRPMSIQGLSDKEGHVARPWDSLFEMVKLAGKKLDWNIGDFFQKSRDLQLQELTLLRDQSSKTASTMLHKQVLYTMLHKQVLYMATVLLLDTMYHYLLKTDQRHFAGSSSHSQQLVLVESLREFKDVHFDYEPKPKKIKLDLGSSPPVVCSPGVVQSTVVVNNFTTAVKCLGILQSQVHQKDFAKLKQHIHADNWPWMQSFMLDYHIYQGEYSEALLILDQFTGTRHAFQLRETMQQASCYFSTQEILKCCDTVLAIFQHLTDSKPNPNRNAKEMLILKGRQIEILTTLPDDIFPYCIHILLLCLWEKVFQNQSNDDFALGHMIILSQYDWPNYDYLFLKAVDKIKQQGCFSYSSFFSYTINIDMLEEFAFMKSQDGGKLNLDILPTSTKLLAQQRTVTRGVNKGVNEDFRMTMEKQVSRSDEDIQSLVCSFLEIERDSIRASLLI